MSKLRVSIAMATYNGAAYIAEQLESIARNSRLPDELVVIDDHSGDHTLALVKTFASKAPFSVRLESNPERLGINATFQRAARLARGDIVLFSDQDDVWLPDHIEALAAPFEADPSVTLVVSDSAYVTADLQPTGQTLWTAERFRPGDRRRATEGWQFPGWVRHRAAAGHGMAFRANLRSIVLPFGDGWIYDRWVSLIAAACGTLVILPRPLTWHRQHSHQAVGHRQRSLTRLYGRHPAIDSEYFSNEIARWTQVRDRLAAHPDRLRDPRVLDVLDARLGFLSLRRSIRRGGSASRMIRATVELVRGTYHRNGRGFLTFARDFLG